MSLKDSMWKQTKKYNV